MSAGKGRADVVQRINSIASTLVIPHETSPDTLPLGGRKSSLGDAPDYRSMEKSGGAVSMGERRLSALTDPNEGVLNLRRVSAGGEEVVIRVRSASQSEESTSGPTTIDFSEPMETIVSPAPSLSHPFSAIASTRSDVLPPLSSFKLLSPPQTSRAPGSKTAQPDSIALAKNKVSDMSPAPAMAQPDTTDKSTTSSETAASVEALKSATDTSARSGASQSPDDFFLGWQGFLQPAHPTLPQGGHSKDLHCEPVLSPKTPSIDPVTVPLPDSPPLPPPLKDQTPVDINPWTAMKAAGDTLSQISIAAQISLTHPIDRPASVSTAESSTHRSSRTVDKRITFLADVVRENEEKRKAAQANGSSTIAMASLENRR